MHSVDLLEEALRLAMNSGFEVRQEWMGERGGGACRLGSRKILFVDLSLTAQEQLEQVVGALRGADTLHQDGMTSRELHQMIAAK